MKDFIEAVDNIYKMIDRTAEMIYEGEVKAYFEEHYGYTKDDNVVSMMLEYLDFNYHN